MRDYVVATVQRVPCSFELALPCVLDIESIRWAPGWAPMPRAAGDSDALKSDDMRPPAWQLRRDEAEQEERRASRLTAARVEYRDTLRWITEEGALPDGLGYFRIAVPWWETKLGPSLASLLDCDDTGLLEPIGPPSMTTLSWNGMRALLPETDDLPSRTLSTQTRPVGAVVSVDLISDKAASPAVSRNLLSLEKPAEQAFKFLSGRIQLIAATFATAHPDPPTAMLNLAFAGLTANENTPLWWLVLTDSEMEHWGPVRLPAVIADRMGQRRTSLRFAGAPLQVLGSLMVRVGPNTSQSKAFPGSLGLVPDRIVAVVIGDRVEDAMFMVTRDTRGSNAGVALSFPAEWDEMLAIAWHGECLINTNHKVSKLVDSSDPLRLAPTKFKSVMDAPQGWCTSAEHVVAAILLLASRGSAELWDTFVASCPEVVEEAYRLLASAGLPDGRLSVLSANAIGDPLITTFTAMGCSSRPIHELPVPAGEVIEVA